MEKFLESIDKQIEFNKGKNIFLDDKNAALTFIDDTVNAISKLSELSADAEKMLIDYATDRALDEFCRINQYYTFNQDAKNDLRGIYSDLFENSKASKKSIESISQKHYDNIRQWLRQTNPFAGKMYLNAEYDIKPVACSEYSVELQLTVLKVDIESIRLPVLDIGCGRQGNLVNYLCNIGIDTYGIDRFSFSDSNLISCDWLEYKYGAEKWGTIVSNLGFSNHFKHHNLREDGNYIEYAMKYIDILKSLKVGGTFHYAPDLPFVEIYLDKRHYRIETFELGEFDFKSTVITRLK